MAYNCIKEIKSNYNLRALIPFDGTTYTKTLLKDLSLVKQYLKSPLSSLLDVGCGLGWHLEFLYKSGYTNLTGIDLSELSLQKFKERLKTRNIKLINEDFFDYNEANKFDCIINFYSCLGQFGILGDRKFIKKFIDTLNNKGCLILSVFTTSKIDYLLGNFEVNYSKRLNLTVHSTLTFNYKTNILIISQSFLDKTLKEEIKIYNETEIVELLKQGGYKTIEIIQGHSSYCSVFVGKKHI